MKAEVAHEPRHGPRHAEHQQPERDDDRASDDVRLIAVLQQQPAEERGACAERDEDRAEAEHEERAQGQRCETLARVRPGALPPERLPGYEGYVGRYERQDAGRHKGDQAGGKCCRKPDGTRFHQLEDPNLQLRIMPPSSCSRLWQ